MALEFTTLVKPANQQVIDPETGQIRPEWDIYLTGLTARMNGAVDMLSSGTAPTDAEYIVGTANGTLTAERVATDTTTVDADMGTAGQAKWNVLEVPGIAATGLVARTAAATYAARTLTAPAAGITVSNGGGVAGDPTLALANDLAALEALGSTGLAARTGADTWAQRTLTAPAAGISVSNGDGASGNPTLALANDLSALEGLGSTGIAVRSAADTWVQRTITAGAGISVSNGDGVSGNPTISATAFSSIVIQTFAATGTYTPTAGMKYCIAEVQAPGGGSGGADGLGQSLLTITAGVMTGGGGGGEYARGVFSAATIGASQAVTIGAVGTAGSNAGGDGGTGGTTSLGALLTAVGGTGSVGSGSNSTSSAPRAGGAGGTGGSGGSFRVPGGTGGPGWVSTLNPDGSGGATFLACPGAGGVSLLGNAPVPTPALNPASIAAIAGKNYGSGAAGGAVKSTTGITGATGGPGIIVITEFI